MRKSSMYQFLLGLVLVSTFVLGLKLPTRVTAQKQPAPVAKATIKNVRDSSTNPAQLPNQAAIQELSSVIADAQSLTNRGDAFRVLSKSANLLWLSAPEKSRAMFQQLWRLSATGENRDELRTDILRYLAPRDAALASKWLDEVAKDSQDPRDAPYSQQVKGSDPTSLRLTNLASKLVQQDDGAGAAKVLERALAVGVTPATLSALIRLRQKNPRLADAAVARTLETLNARPTVVSLPSLYLLVDYLFPASNVDAIASNVNPPSQTLRSQYFSTAYNAVKKSLTESEVVLVKENGYTKPDLRFRAIYQSQVASVLVTLAPRFGREVAPEIAVLARESYGAVAPNAAVMSRLTRMRLSYSEETSGDKLTDIAVALAKGDVARAEEVLGSVDDVAAKRAAGQTVAKVAFSLRLAKAELNEALLEARKLEDPSVRAIAYAQLARVARSKDPDFARLILADALNLFSVTNPSGLEARAMLMLAPEALVSSTSDSLSLLLRAVTVINNLPEVAGPSDEYNLDDPLSFRDSPELQRAFATIAAEDYDGTLTVAKQVGPPVVSLLARLATVEAELKKVSNKSKLMAKVSHHAVKQLGPAPELTAAFLNRSVWSTSVAIIATDKKASSSFGFGKVAASLSPKALPGPWWDCTSECLRSAGVSPIEIAACAATCVYGLVPLCAICFALNVTAFNFCALYCAVYANPTYGTCLGWSDFVTYPSSGCVTGLFFQGPCTRSDAFRSRCEDYDEESCVCLGGGYMSPIVIDIDHSGFSMTDAAGGVVFDMLKDGVPLGLSWTAPGSTNALLVLDRNDNAKVDNGEELFGDITPQSPSSAPNGFLALADYDKRANGGNGNGKMDSQDAIFSQLRLWQDANHNGISEAAELKPLAGLISAIDLNYKESRRTDQYGNQFRYRAKVYDAKGEHAGRWAWDVYLTVQ